MFLSYVLLYILLYVIIFYFFFEILYFIIFLYFIIIFKYICMYIYIYIDIYIYKYPKIHQNTVGLPRYSNIAGRKLHYACSCNISCPILKQVKISTYIHSYIRFEGSSRIRSFGNTETLGRPLVLLCAVTHVLKVERWVMVKGEHTINDFCHSDITVTCPLGVLAFVGFAIQKVNWLFGFCTVCVSCFPNQQLMNLHVLSATWNRNYCELYPGQELLTA